VPAELVAAAHAAHTAQTAPSSQAAAPLALPQDGLDLRAHLDAIERQLIEQALQRSGGIVAHAARLLGLRRTTLVEKLRKFSLVADEAYAPES
jgi:sigma-54 specific flagellar transcriptional regulator A